MDVLSLALFFFFADAVIVAQPKFSESSGDVTDNVRSYEVAEKGGWLPTRGERPSTVSVDALGFAGVSSASRLFGPCGAKVFAR
jgi:hypothetical protein